MNALKSLAEDQIVRDTAGNQLLVRFEFNAPDRMRYTIENGPTSVQIGSNDYQQKPDGIVVRQSARRAVRVAAVCLCARWPSRRA